MYEKLNEEIIKVKSNIQTKNKLNEKLKTVKNDIYNTEKSLQTLKETLIKEEKDVKRLEGISLSAIIYAILGNKQEHIDKEEKEYIQAKIRYDDCNQQIMYLTQEKETILNKLNEIGYPEYDYNLLMNKKEELIMNMDKEKAEQLSELFEIQSQWQHNIKELTEAINAGNKAKISLQKMIASLQKAEDLGTWDLLGGGTLTTMAKHSRIDEAKETLTEVKYYLNSFNRELKDVVHVSIANLDVNISSFDTFADYFFDGFFSDLSVQNKIKDSLSNVQQTLSRVSNIIFNLEHEIRKCENKLGECMEERLKVLEYDI